MRLHLCQDVSDGPLFRLKSLHMALGSDRACIVRWYGAVGIASCILFRTSTRMTRIIAAKNEKKVGNTNGSISWLRYMEQRAITPTAHSTYASGWIVTITVAIGEWLVIPGDMRRNDGFDSFGGCNLLAIVVQQGSFHVVSYEPFLFLPNPRSRKHNIVSTT